jgi:hypothetical protein
VKAEIVSPLAPVEAMRLIEARLDGHIGRFGRVAWRKPDPLSRPLVGRTSSDGADLWSR